MKSTTTPATNHAAAARPIAPLKPLPNLKPVASAVAPGTTTEDRRRGQRVFLRVRTSIHVALQGKATTFDAMTVSVNHNGALLVLNQSLPINTHLVLEHATTKDRIPCKVIRSAQSMPEGFHTPVEFDTPSPNFWHIAFPPPDWRAPDDL
jgi:hypothetical protein